MFLSIRIKVLEYCCEDLKSSNYVRFWGIGPHSSPYKKDKNLWLIMGYDDPDGERVFYCPFCGVKLNDET